MKIAVSLHKIKNMQLFTIIKNSTIRAQAVADNAIAHTATIALVDERTVVFERKPTVQMLLDRMNAIEDDLEVTFRKINSNEQKLVKSFTY